MTIDAQTALVLIAAVGLVSMGGWAWRVLFGARALERRLRASGFEPCDDGLRLRAGAFELSARIVSGKLHLHGPLLPPGVPAFHSTAEGMGIGPAKVWSGDLVFDRRVRTEHEDPHVGLAWLTHDVRSAVADAVDLSAAIVDGRWTFEGPVAPHHVDGLVRALVRASEAMALPPRTVDGALQQLARHDPEPSVRAHAIDMLDARGGAPDALADLADHRQPEVLLALIRRGGSVAQRAWTTLQACGGARERVSGALVLASRGAGEMDERAVNVLLEALSDAVLGEDAARALARSDVDGLRERVRERFGDAPPDAARSLLVRRARAERAQAAGAVSVVEPNGGALSVPGDGPPRG
jgi:hypothetical protein